MRSRTGIAALLVALAAALAVAQTARADGDPASDILVGDSVYLPYGGVSSGAERALRDTVRAARLAGYPVRVAVIAAQQDLGAVTALWAQPRRYATFLSLELSLFYKGPLLIVMPAGPGFAHRGHGTKAEYAALAGLSSGTDRDALTLSAAEAVRRLAAAAGHTLPQVSSSSGGSTPVWAIALGAAGGVVLLAGAGFAVLRRRRAAS